MFGKKLKIIFSAVFLLSASIVSATYAAGAVERLSGRMLLQVEGNGEAWYVYPDDLMRYYLGRPADAFDAMRTLSLGISDKDFNSFRVSMPTRLSGRILLKAEDKGKAYYVNPDDLKMHYLGRPDDAFRIMRELGLGITDKDLSGIPIGTLAQSRASIRHDAPFTSQAPFGEWSDRRHQDGCEEASALMAVKWAKGEKLDAQTAKKQIESASDYQKEKYGEYRDASVEDILARIIKDYFRYENSAVKKGVSKDDLKSQLYAGRTIIAPMNGQKLGNPNFTAPGPINHMLLIIGYDPVKKEFITNDPGTRKGEGYRYGEDVLFDALRAYPTGYHEPNPDIEKDVILVWK